ncbi:hypothetical protein IL306_004308 [Fusarium sp. DS 682]|nr:hypothetical protein IL306_004308 [Fusarium sp. DS 682]
MRVQLGNPLPPGDQHAGYPRVHPGAVNKLAHFLVQWTVWAAPKIASDSFRSQLDEVMRNPALPMIISSRRQARTFQEDPRALTKGFYFAFPIDFNGQVYDWDDPETGNEWNRVYVIMYNLTLAKDAKEFLHNTGFGISSRTAAYWLENAPFLNPNRVPPAVDLPIEEAKYAKIALQQRIADMFSTNDNKLNMDDVFLHSNGMSAVTQTLDIISQYPSGGSTVAIFGFHNDKAKLLDMLLYECRIYGSSPSDLDTLEEDLNSGRLELCALYTEFTSIPSLNSVDIERIQKLSIKHNFVFIIDDPAGTSVNVDLISYCDVVCTSLTNFSRSCNVMGGSIALNPKGRGYFYVKSILNYFFQDTFFPLDAILLEKSGADFEEQVIKASQNAEHIADMLRKHPSVEQVYYPKGSPTQDNYEKYKRPGKGYGYLLFIRFKTPDAVIAFHEALNMAKGPYHYNPAWAAEYGVVEHLVWINVGIEKEKFLEEIIKTALDAAERVKKDMKAPVMV